MSGYGIVSNMAQYLCTLALEKLMRMLRINLYNVFKAKEH
jgi:hypothetical protein